MADTTYLELDENNQAIAGPFIVDPDQLNPVDSAVAIDGVDPTPQVGWRYNSITKEWTPDSISAPIIDIVALRELRNRRLELCDYIALRHSDGKDPEAPFNWSEWDTYRQALRDITVGYIDTPADQINWPTEPINS